MASAYQLRQETEGLRAKREALVREREALQSREPPTAAQILAEIEAGGGPSLPEEVRSKHRAEIAAAEAAVRDAAVRTREREQRAAVAVAELAEGVRGVTALVQARGEREQAALEREWDRMLPSALDEWRFLDDRVQEAQQRLLACIAETASLCTATSPPQPSVRGSPRRTTRDGSPRSVRL